MFEGLSLFIGPGVAFKPRAICTLGKYSTTALDPQLPGWLFYKIYFLFLLIRFFLLYVGMCVCMWVCRWEWRYLGRPEASDPLGLESYMVVSCLIWIQGTKHWSERPGNSLTCWAISPVPFSLLLSVFWEEVGTGSWIAYTNFPHSM